MSSRSASVSGICARWADSPEGGTVLEASDNVSPPPSPSQRIGRPPARRWTQCFDAGLGDAGSNPAWVIMKKRRRVWRIWAKALGEKASTHDSEADRVAAIRTFIFVSYLVTNMFIVAGVIRHWNDAL